MAAIRRMVLIHQLLKSAYAFKGGHYEIKISMSILKKYCSIINSTERQYNQMLCHLKRTYHDLPPQILAHLFSLVPEPTTNTEAFSRKKRFRPSGVEINDCYSMDTFRRPYSSIVIARKFKRKLRKRLAKERKGKTLFQLCKRYITKNKELLHSYYTARIGRISEFVHENPDLTGETCNLIQSIVNDNDNKMIMIGDIETGDLFRIQQKTLASQLPPSSS